MMTIEIGGRVYQCSRYTVRAFELGGWSADVEVAADDVPAGACVLGGWRGTVRTVTRNGAVARLDVHAGDDALDAATTARHWAAAMPASSVLAALAAEAGTAASGPADVTLATWRAMGGTLRAELARLGRWIAGGAWYVDELTGAVRVERRDASAADAPGRHVGSGAAWRAYEVEPGTLAVLTGRSVDGVRVASTVHAWGGSGPPLCELYAPPPVAGMAPGTVQGGTLEAASEDRATIRLDDGTVLGDVPLWFSAGIRATLPSGCRVLVVDMGGDPRAPVAFASPFDAVPSGDLGTALRVGDVIMMPVGSAATPTPTPIELGPGQSSFGAPGSGCSRVKL